MGNKKLLVLAMSSLLFAESPDEEGRKHRNPFTSPLTQSVTAGDVISGVVFGSASAAPGSAAQWQYAPRIVVTGVMEAQGKHIACAEVEGVGSTILKVGDRVVVPNAAESGRSAWFLVNSIERNTMSITLDDGIIVSGRLF